LSHQGDYFSGFRETSFFFFGKNNFSIHDNFINTAAALDEFNIQVLSECCQQFILQPGGTGFIVSLTTVFNTHFHNFSHKMA